MRTTLRPVDPHGKVTLVRRSCIGDGNHLNTVVSWRQQVSHCMRHFRLKASEPAYRLGVTSGIDTLCILPGRYPENQQASCRVSERAEVLRKCLSIIPTQAAITRVCLLLKIQTDPFLLSLI
jgi:hypothetical protein